MEKFQHDDYKAYGWCGLLATDEWDTYIRDPLNENVRSAFIAKMTNKEEFPKNASTPYGIFYKSMAMTVGKIEKGCRWVDQRHLNGFGMILIIVTILHAKKKNDIIANVVSDDLNHDKLHLQVHICYKVTQSKHSTPSSQDELANTSTGKYQVIPVSVYEQPKE
jgi:hypothetical protein